MARDPILWLNWLKAVASRESRCGEMRNELVGGDEDKRQNAPLAGNHTKEPIFSTEGTHRLQIINSMMAELCWKNVNYKTEKRPWLIIILLV